MRRRRMELVGIGALVFAYAFLVQPSGDNQRAHFALVRALADGNASVEEYVRTPELRTVDVTRVDGHLYAAKAPGLAAVSVPWFAALEGLGADPDNDHEDVIWALHLWACVLPALALLLTVRAVGNRFEPGLGGAAAITLGAATLVLPFGTLFFSHVLAAALAFGGFALLVARRSPAAVAVAGLLVGLGTSVEYPIGLTAVALLIYTAVVTRRPALVAAFGAGVCAGVFPALAYNEWAFGSPFRFPYEGWTAGAGAKPLPGIFGLTLPDPLNAEALLFAPAGLASLAAGFAGAVVVYRRGMHAIGLLLLALPLAYLLYNASFIEPFGGGSPGPRYLISVMPFLAAPLAVAYAAFPGAALGLACATGAFLAGATLTSPIAAWDSHVLQRLTSGGYVPSVLKYAGLHGGAADLPFVVALGVAAVVVLALVRPYLHRRDAAAFVVTTAGWAVIGSQSRRLLEHGPSWRVGLALVAVAAATAAVTVAIYRVRSHAPAAAPAEAR